MKTLETQNYQWCKWELIKDVLRHIVVELLLSVFKIECFVVLPFDMLNM